MSRNRVVVTGVGMVNALGTHVEECFSNMLAGKSGARRIRFFDPVNHRTKFGCEPPAEFADTLKQWTSPRFREHTLKFCQYGYVAARQMLEDYPVDWTDVDRDRVGVPVGVSGAGIYGSFRERDAITRSLANVLPSWISMEYGIDGPSFVVSTACSSGADAIATACRMIQSGELDMAITGGADGTITGECVNGFNAIMALSERNDEPEKASRPFDRDRTGFVMGEGAGICLLEAEEHALKRGATILAELAGFASTSEATNIVAPKDGGAGMIVTMQKALKSAGLTPADVDYVSAHGTSTTQNDRSEALAIKELFGSGNVLISSQKSQIGHCIGAAGGIEFVTTALTVSRGLVTPTLNLDNPEPEWADLDFVPYDAREARVRAAISNSFAFGGHNCTLVIRQYER